MQVEGSALVAVEDGEDGETFCAEARQIRAQHGILRTECGKTSKER